MSRDIVFLQELVDVPRNFLFVILKGKMSGIQQSQLEFLDILPVCLRAGSVEDNVILAPDGQHRDARRAEVFLELWVQLHVGAVVVEEVKLDVLVAGAFQQRLVEVPRLRRDPLRVLCPDCILRPGRVEDQELPQPVPVLRAAARPVFPARHPEVRLQALHVRVPILRDDGGHRAGARQGQPERHGGPVVEDVHGEAVDPQGVEECFGGVCQVREGVLVAAPLRDLGKPEAWQVGGDDPILGCQQGDEVAVHERGSWEAVEQEDNRCRFRTRSAVEDVHTVGLNGIHDEGLCYQAFIGRCWGRHLRGSLRGWLVLRVLNRPLAGDIYTLESNDESYMQVNLRLAYTCIYIKPRSPPPSMVYPVAPIVDQ